MNWRLRIPLAHLSDRVYMLNKCKNNKYGANPLCTHSNKTNELMEASEEGRMTRDEAYRQLQNLDFMTATKILLTAPPKREKFGLDFHLVQLFFVCLPPLAVYLVAQYARKEMRKMDEELQQKKKRTEEQEKAKEVEKAALRERSDSELLEVKGRLNALEETVKKIATERKKTVQVNMAHGTDGGALKKTDVTSEPVRGSTEAVAAADRNTTSSSVNNQPKSS